jgi:dolichol-phosphate mannosyltransferase
MIHISVVIPLYKCSAFIEELTLRLIKTLDQINPKFEIIYINDASPENDWEIVKRLAANENRIKGISLSRNFGQHYAITAGLDAAKGEWVVVMDGDLQDVPEEIVKLYHETQNGFDVVQARRFERKDSWFKKMWSRAFYKVFGYLTDTEQDATIGNFGIYHEKVIESINSLGDSIRYFPTLVQFVGFNRTKINVNHAYRDSGKSAYTLKSLLDLSFNNIIAFSDKPLRLTLKFGVLIVVLSFMYAIFILIKYLTGGISVSGFTTMAVSIWFLAGVIIMLLGMLGLYLGKTFDKVKDRPAFIIRSKINLTK